MYIFNIDDDKLKDILNYATQNHLITFTSSVENMQKGVNIFFDFQKDIEIYLNKESIQKSNIEFKSTFLKAIKIYDSR